jgi:3-oxoacyl-[acyl-carrier protein] reductase
MKLDGRVATVTGAGCGIGRAIALRFGHEGAAVYLPDKDLDGADETAHEIRRSGGEAVACQTDVTDAEAVDLTVHGTIDAFGQVDILVNNAGISWSKQILELSNDEWDLMIRTHLHGCFYFSRAVAKNMVQRNQGGKILNMSSVSGIVGSVGRPTIWRREGWYDHSDAHHGGGACSPPDKRQCSCPRTDTYTDDGTPLG